MGATGGHKTAVISASLIFIMACHPGRPVHKDAAQTADQAAQTADQAAPTADQFVSKTPGLAIAGGIGGDARGHGIAVDSAGNRYVTGKFYGKPSFGVSQLASGGLLPWDVFVAKLDRNGQWIWASSAGTSWYYDDGTAIAIDGAGNSYITGRCDKGARFGSKTLSKSGIFVAKLDSAGKWLWVVSADGNSKNIGNGIAISGGSTIYVVGSFSGTTTFNATKLSSKGQTDVVVAKLDSAGKWLWARAAGGTNYDAGHGISVDGAGSVYVTGNIYGTASFGVQTLTSKGSDDIFVAKLNDLGTWLWAVPAGGTGKDAGNGISSSHKGQSTVCGKFVDKASFGPTTLTSKGASDLFVARLDSAGKWLWATSGGGTGSDICNAVVVDGAGRIHVAGQISYPNATFGSTTVSSKGLINILVARLDSTGTWQWARSAGGTSTDYGRGISADSAGNSHVTGWFGAQGTFGPHTVLGQGYDLFVWQVNK